MTSRTWVIWDRTTGQALLEVLHVPTDMREFAVIATLVQAEAWPVPSTDPPQRHDHMVVGWALTTPTQVLAQFSPDPRTPTVRKYEWEGLAAAAAEEPPATRYTGIDPPRPA